MDFEERVFPDRDKFNFMIYYVRLQMFRERPDISDDEIKEALIANAFNVHKSIVMVESKHHLSDLNSY